MKLSEMKHPSMEGFTAYIEERERIRKKKETGKKHPLTDDPILGKYRFCNVRREDDTFSRWLAENVWNQPTGTFEEKWDLLCNAILHRCHSNLDTAKELGFVRHMTKGKNDPEPDVYVMDKFREFRKAKKPWGTFSFHTAPIEKRWDATCGWLFCSGDGAWSAAETHFEEELFPNGNKTTLEHFCKEIINCDGVGKFLAWQITADLTQTALLNKAPDLRTWCDPGPGAREGLRQLGLPQDLEGVRAVMAAHNKKSRVKLDAKDTQHNLCEYAKFDYTFHGRARPKRRYAPSYSYLK